MELPFDSATGLLKIVFSCCEVLANLVDFVKRFPTSVESLRSVLIQRRPPRRLDDVRAFHAFTGACLLPWFSFLLPTLRGVRSFSPFLVFSFVGCGFALPLSGGQSRHLHSRRHRRLNLSSETEPPTVRSAADQAKSFQASRFGSRSKIEEPHEFVGGHASEIAVQDSSSHRKI